MTILGIRKRLRHQLQQASDRANLWIARALVTGLAQQASTGPSAKSERPRHQRDQRDAAARGALAYRDRAGAHQNMRALPQDKNGETDWKFAGPYMNRWVPVLKYCLLYVGVTNAAGDLLTELELDRLCMRLINTWHGLDAEFGLEETGFGDTSDPRDSMPDGPNVVGAENW